MVFWREWRSWELGGSFLDLTHHTIDSANLASESCTRTRISPISEDGDPLHFLSIQSMA